MRPTAKFPNAGQNLAYKWWTGRIPQLEIEDIAEMAANWYKKEVRNADKSLIEKFDADQDDP